MKTTKPKAIYDNQKFRVPLPDLYETYEPMVDNDVAWGETPRITDAYINGNELVLVYDVYDRFELEEFEDTIDDDDDDEYSYDDDYEEDDE